ncbi:MAG TPA: protein kinase, partial [Nannocystaceae bacterium]|nr:protein kinase [Nannocystaceae bacterium]
MIAPEAIPADVVVHAGPTRVGSELRWTVRSDDGEGVLAQLAPELARDEAVRRRWVADAERMQSLDVEGYATPTRIGPAPDPRDAAAAPPWRIRPRPPGIALDEWLAARAPAPIDEVTALLLAICGPLAELHAHGRVIRDLAPRNIVVAPDGAVCLVDIGLSRTEVLSSRTAASLVLQGSPYLAPELLRRTHVDTRCDLFALGVIAYVALTGVPPWGDTPALLRPAGDAPRARALRDAIPRELDALIASCLADDPAARPDSVGDVVAALQGRPLALAEQRRVHCQSCGAPMRMGQRLCIACGRTTVLFEHAPPDTSGTVAIELTKAAEDAQFVARLREILTAVSEDKLPPLNFLIGDERMYSKAEKQRMLRLPLRLFDRLTPATASAMQERMRGLGLQTRIVSSAPQLRRQLLVPAIILASTIAIAAPLFVFGMTAPASIILIVGFVASMVLTKRRRVVRARTRDPILRLRAAPAALPASDPWVGRIAALLKPSTAADVREQIGELALLLQRLVDHRVEHARERAEIDAVTTPVAELVGLIERTVAELDDHDRELAGLDEGELVRQLARSEARGDAAERTRLQHALERLRVLEEARAGALHRLLEAGS